MGNREKTARMVMIAFNSVSLPIFSQLCPFLCLLCLHSAPSFVCWGYRSKKKEATIKWWLRCRPIFHHIWLQILTPYLFWQQKICPLSEMTKARVRAAKWQWGPFNLPICVNDQPRVWLCDFRSHITFQYSWFLFST